MTDIQNNMLPVGPITRPDIDFETFSMEELDDEIGCEIEHHRCQSKHTEPATWLISHQRGKPQCTFLVCEPCVMNLQNWIARGCVENGVNNFGCSICGLNYFSYRLFITRKL